MNVRLVDDVRPIGGVRARMLLDVLHAGNPQGPVRLVEEKYEPQIGGAATVLNANYRQPVSYQPPMMARLGMEVDF